MSVDEAALAAIPWGLLGPDALPSERRARALELGAAVQHYHDLAVPGLGRVWYGRQLLWPTLGVVVADAVRQKGQRHSNIEVANSIEALACWLALKYGSIRRDRRLRGVTKLRIDVPSSFRQLSRVGAYVSQPMRMSAVQPLRALGLVTAESDRFNAFVPSATGEAFVHAACAEFDPIKNRDGVVAYLERWVLGEHADADRAGLCKALTPLDPLPAGARATLRDRLISGPLEPANRRRAALAWVAQVDAGAVIPGWDDPQRPPMLSARHWHDLRLGAAFFNARDLAIAALDCVERAIGPERKPLSLDGALPANVEQALQSAAAAATHWLNLAEQDREHPDAVSFCRQLVTGTAADRLQALVERDGRVLQLRDHAVIPAAAFEGEALLGIEDGASPDEAPKDGGLGWPEGISYRIRNLHLLHLDLDGDSRLGDWLKQGAAE